MSAKTLWALGAVLFVTLAVILFRAEHRDRADVVPATPDDAALSQPQPTAPAQEPTSSDSAVAAPEGSESTATRDAQQTAPVLLPHQIAPTPMIQALTDAAGARPGVETGDFLRSPPPELREAEQAFAAEPVDPQWSTATEASILGKIAQINGLSVVDLNVECRTTKCRLQMVQPRVITPGAPGNPFFDLVDTVGLKPLWVISVFNPSGGLTSVAYFTRGEPAPAP